MVWSNPSPTLVAPEEFDGVSVFAVVPPPFASGIEAFGFEKVDGEPTDCRPVAGALKRLLAVDSIDLSPSVACIRLRS